MAQPLHPSVSKQRTYEDTFQNVINRINDAVHRSQVSSKKYTKVAVLSLRWSNDELNLGAVEADLLRTFGEVYGFPTKSFLIPANSRTYQSDVITRVHEVMRTVQGETSLFIIVYEGYAERTTITTGNITHETLQLFGSTAPNAPRLNYDSVRVILDGFLGDAFIIMDCCEAATAALRLSEHEYLFASALKTSNTADIADNFTSRLIALLRANRGVEITIAQLHSFLVADPGGPGKIFDNNPVHVAPCTKPSITLRHSRKPGKEIDDLQKGDTRADGKVLISVRLHGKHTQPGIKQWEKLLTESLPKKDADIKIQGIFEAGSYYICLLTIPIEVWDMMTDDLAYSFIGFVQSNNISLQTEPSPSEYLPGFVQTVSGNIPHRSRVVER